MQGTWHTANQTQHRFLYLRGHFAAVDADRRAAALLQHTAALDLHAVTPQPAAIRQLHIIDGTWPLSAARQQFRCNARGGLCLLMRVPRTWSLRGDACTVTDNQWQSFIRIATVWGAPCAAQKRKQAELLREEGSP